MMSLGTSASAFVPRSVNPSTLWPTSGKHNNVYAAESLGQGAPPSSGANIGVEELTNAAAGLSI